MLSPVKRLFLASRRFSRSFLSNFYNSHKVGTTQWLQVESYITRYVTVYLGKPSIWLSLQANNVKTTNRLFLIGHWCQWVIKVNSPQQPSLLRFHGDNVWSAPHLISNNSIKHKMWKVLLDWYDLCRRITTLLQQHNIHIKHIILHFYIKLDNSLGFTTGLLIKVKKFDMLQVTCLNSITAYFCC